MMNTGPINIVEDTTTRPFNLAELAEAQSGWVNKKEI